MNLAPWTAASDRFTLAPRGDEQPSWGGPAAVAQTPRPVTLSAADIAALTPLAAPSADPTEALRRRMQRTGQWAPHQTAGRRWPVACVSLEITQRCNLDCTLCYLSETSEAVRDFPLDEVMRRIELIHAHYGPGTDVQVSGGEPTLRRRDELLAIVAKIASMGMRASLFTNGIKATRELLQELAQAGLTDVAFHVDTTQQRAGYANETELNALRSQYIERARGLPLSVFFNTTVHAGNFVDIPALTAFFIGNADVVRFASFQLQAETGRGVLGARAEAIDNHSVAARLQRGAGTALRFNVLQAGHSECNRSAVLLAIGGRVYDAFEDEAFVARFMRETAHLRIDRGTPWRALRCLRAAPPGAGPGDAALGGALRLEGAPRPDRRARPGAQADAVHAQLHGRLFAGPGAHRRVRLHGDHARWPDRHVRLQRAARPLAVAAAAQRRRPVAAAQRDRRERRQGARHPAEAPERPGPRGRAARARAAPQHRSGSMNRWIAHLLGGLALSAFAGCSTLVPPPSVPAASQADAIAAWSRVLERFVDRRGEVDFAALANDRADLDAYVRHVADTPLDTLHGREHKLAHMINAYNALSMFNAVESGIPASHAGLAKVQFFVLRKLLIGGQVQSLYAFENDTVRPFTRSIGEPRVHFALNCSAVSCPALPRTPFRAATLDAELERETRAFFARPENFRADASTRVVWLSEILKFYPEDFVPAHGRNPIDFANRYAPQPAPLDWDVRFTPYDWTVANSRRAREEASRP